MDCGEKVSMRTKSHANNRKTWQKSVDYLFNICGLNIGLANVWRFPYLCYKNGGGAFLVAYFFIMIALVCPIIILESAVGQYTGKSAIHAWYIIPILKGIGYTSPVLMFYSILYYPVILAWVARWFVAAFDSDKPWTTCDNSWNTKHCLPLKLETDPILQWNDTSNNTLPANTDGAWISSVEEFWRRNILQMSQGVEEPNGVNWGIFLGLLVIWVLVYFSTWKGIGWTSKIVYFTVTMPMVMLIIVLVRGVTLPGAAKGIEVYLKPNLTKLAEAEVWTDAASQLMYSFGAVGGGITTLSAYNKFRHNFVRDCITYFIVGAGVSFFSGFTIFSVLGFLAQAKNTTIANVAESGPGLVFIAYPTALSLLPLPQFWCALFFMMVLLLGFDSQYVYVETFTACMKTAFPRPFRKKWSYEVILAIICTLQFVLGISMVTRGGAYVLNIFNTYAITGWCLYFIAFCEFIAIGWLYWDNMVEHIRTMTGYNFDRLLFKLCWKYSGPLITLALMINSLVQYRPMKYDQNYVYPVWAEVIGWMTAFSSMLWIPGVALRVIWKADGNSFLEKIRNAAAIPVMKKRDELNDDELHELDGDKKPAA